MKNKTLYITIALLVILLLLTGYFYFWPIETDTPVPQPEEIEDEIETPDEEEAEEVYEISEAGVKSLASDVVSALKNEDFGKFAGYVHPEKGVRFSPYSYVELQDDIVLLAQEIEAVAASDREFIWGVYDGKGNPIEMSFAEYYNRFIYDVDFESADQIAYNDIISAGNMIQNVEEAYENAHHVEYYIPGLNPDYGGMDWRSLRLVFEESNGKLYLVGVIHNEWTI